MQETVNPGRAAKMVGVSGSTMRFWTKTYAEFLSAGANPTPGEERRYTNEDLEVLRAVNQLRHNGMLPADIALRLRNNAAAGVQDAAGAPADAASAPISPQIDQNALVPASEAIQAIFDRYDKLASIDRRLERIEHWRNLVIVGAAAFAAGAVVVAAIVWLLIMVR